MSILRFLSWSARERKEKPEKEAWVISRYLQHGSPRRPSTAEEKDLRRRLAAAFGGAADARAAATPARAERSGRRPFGWLALEGLGAAAAITLLVYGFAPRLNHGPTLKGPERVEVELYAGAKPSAAEQSGLVAVQPEGIILQDRFLQFRLLSSAASKRYVYLGALDEAGVFTWYFPSPESPGPIAIASGRIEYSPVSVDIGSTHRPGIIRPVIVEASTEDLGPRLDEALRGYAGMQSYDVRRPLPNDLFAEIPDLHIDSFLLSIKSLR